MKHGRIRIHDSNSNEAPRGTAEFHNPYTPGPYTLSGGGYVAICAMIKGVSRQIGRSEVVGTPGVISDQECEANASLFAAAPELLDALKEAVDVIGDAEWRGEAKARAAIAKAEGR